MPILKNIDITSQILKKEMELLEKQSSRWLSISETGRKIIKKGAITFYFVEVSVNEISREFVYSEYDPLLVKDGDSFQLVKKEFNKRPSYHNCYCTFVKSPTEFTLVFEEYIPTILNERINKINPSANIKRQIQLIEGLKDEKKRVQDDLKYIQNSKNLDSSFQKTLGSYHSFLLTIPSSCKEYGNTELSRYCYYNKPDSNSEITFSNKYLTTNQKKSIERAVKAPTFHLIHGPPGTGKTTVITDIVLNLIAEGKKVLICSWMNVAVDNILEKLIKSKKLEHDEIVRIGAGSYKVSKDVQTILLQGSHYDPEKKLKVVGSTLASAHISRNLNGGERFDVVIIDEAGASTVTQTLLGLHLGKKFILVGDHYQLPPILQVNSENSGIPAQYIEDMKTSLFEYLIERWPNFLTILDTQYRMDEKIAELSNILVYNEMGRLRTGTDTTKNYLPADNKFKIKAPGLHVKSHNELKKILCKDFPLIWLNVEGRHEWDTVLKSSSGQRSAYNMLEVEVIEGMYRYLKQALPNLRNEDIGIIATYRKQVEKLNERFGDEILNGLEISTVDSFQGKEKDIILFSTVYAPQALKRKNQGVPNIFKDKRRFNVAFTRAKYKLVMVGDIELVRRDVKYFQEAYKHIRDAYGDPNNNYSKRGIVKDYELCDYLENLNCSRDVLCEMIE